jgi:hypothetical protein
VGTTGTAHGTSSPTGMTAPAGNSTSGR